MNFSTYSNELHKQVIRDFQRRRVIANYTDEIWAGDLIDFTYWEKFNDDYKYILCVIDVFSKYAWAIPLKDKTATSINKAFKDIIKYNKRKPKYFWCDKGSEFYNNIFLRTLKTQDITIYSTYGEHKASVVERFNRTIKTWIWKYFSSKNTAEWIGVLPELMATYNSKKHRSIGMSPTQASKPDNHEKVFNKLYANNLKELIESHETPRYQVGDLVRLSRMKDIFEKGMVDNWTKQLYKVSEVLPTYPITYKITDFDGEAIEGSFYQDELQKTEVPNHYDIEKVIKTRTRNGRKEYLVKFIGWDKKYNRWITANKKKEYETLQD